MRRSTLTKASASRKPGTIWNASTTRISASSTSPPAKPASVPTSEPMTMATTAAAMPTASEARAPWTQPGQHVAAEPVGAERKGGVGEGRHQRAARRSPADRRERGRRRSSAASASRREHAPARSTPSGERRSRASTLMRSPPRRRRAGRAAHRRCRRARLTRITSTALTTMMPIKQRRVAAGDRLLRQPAEARNGEDALDDDAAAEHGRRLQPEHGDERQQARCARCGAARCAGARAPWRARPAQNPAARLRPCRRASCAGTARDR